LWRTQSALIDGKGSVPGDNGGLLKENQASGRALTPCWTGDGHSDFQKNGERASGWTLMVAPMVQSDVEQFAEVKVRYLTCNRLDIRSGQGRLRLCDAFLVIARNNSGDRKVLTGLWSGTL
jgi:hypothetical protein